MSKFSNQVFRTTCEKLFEKKLEFLTDFKDCFIFATIVQINIRTEEFIYKPNPLI